MRFSPTAWAKLLFLRDCGSTEVGGFGITCEEDLLYVEDVRLVRQTCTVVSVAFDDTSVAEFFDEQVDAGRRPEQFARLWLHSHPAGSAAPSSVDEETFARAFGSSNWAVMFIVSRTGETYCRLRFSAGPGGSIRVPVEIDFAREFGQSDFTKWSAEYAACVRPAETALRCGFSNRVRPSNDKLPVDTHPALNLADLRAPRKEPFSNEQSF